jgi:ubiquinone/menaquinone biosynthesis C-methylase UbiE
MVQITEEQWTAYSLGAKFREIEVLRPIRDKLLDRAELAEGFVVLDVGCGDGLIGFAALDRVGPRGKVIFSDISQGLINHCRAEAEQLGVAERCVFLRAPMDDLAALPEASVDAVTARSVLNHVPPVAKPRAFRECYRVLKPGRRLSTFQPINRFAALPPEPPYLFRGFDATAVQGLIDKVRAFIQRKRPLATHASLHYDERDLFQLAAAAGFRHVDLEYAAWQRPPKPGHPEAWDTFLHARRGPGARELSLHETIQGALTPAESERFIEHLRPLVEAGQTVPRSSRFAQAYLWATK